jgi:hypothetical protein
MTITTVIANTVDPRAREELFRKVLPQAQAEMEVRGWNAVARHLTVPRLLESAQTGEQGIVTYEHVFETGRCQLLLGDVISAADHGMIRVARVNALIDAVCRELCLAAEHTGRPGRLDECVSALYSSRLREGGRIDQWYLHSPGPSAISETADGPTDLRDFSGWDLRVNDRTYTFDLPGVIAAIRGELSPANQWLTALTQGDPTEPNIAEPLCWLDFEHAGRNVLVGEMANLLWYLLGMGGWLVPRYQPAIYARTLRLALPPVTAPVIGDVDISVHRRCAELRYTWRTGPGRQAAIKRLLTWLTGDLGAALGCAPTDMAELLRPFLIMRILGVIPGRSLDRMDALLMLVKVAEASNPEMVLSEFASTTVHTTPEARQP